MKKSNIFITRPIPSIGIERLQKKHVVYIRKNDTPISRKELLRQIKKTHALVSILTDRIDETVMDAAPHLQVIANYAVGFDNIDIAAATERGIVVTNTPATGVAVSVAEHTITLMLAVARRIVESDTFTRAEHYKAWMPAGFIGPSLIGKTLGIVGAGRIGLETARIAHAGLRMKILYTDIEKNAMMEKEVGAQYQSLNQLCKKADVISIHVPLLDSTRHLIDEEQFRLMKKTAIVINTSRGPVVSEKPLVRALKTGRIFGAGIDVFENEPYIDVDPTDDLVLKDMKHVVLTPHIASATQEARDEMSMLVARGILGVLQNRRPISIVNPEVWKKRKYYRYAKKT